MKKLIIAALLLSTLSASSYQAYLETLMGIRISSRGISVQVYSGGCTNKDSFAVSKQDHYRTSEITFLRVVPDTCEAYLPWKDFILFERRVGFACWVQY